MYSNMFEAVIICVTGENGPYKYTKRIRLEFVGSCLFDTDDVMLCAYRYKGEIFADRSSQQPDTTRGAAMSIRKSIDKTSERK